MVKHNTNFDDANIGGNAGQKSFKDFFNEFILECNVSGRVVQPTDGTHARFITNGYLRMKHGRGRCNGIEMISRGLLNKSSLFRYFILCVV